MLVKISERKKQTRFGTEIVTPTVVRKRTIAREFHTSLNCETRAKTCNNNNSRVEHRFAAVRNAE